MPSIQLDRAYCEETESVLTIYQVRDLHFDETVEFNAKTAHFLCPDPDCHVPLVGVNHTKAIFKNTPHFRLPPNVEHRDECDYLIKKSDVPIGYQETRRENRYKYSEYPEELVLERSRPPIERGCLIREEKDPQNIIVDENKPRKDDDSFALHKTYCLEHVVEVWLANNHQKFESALLTIGSTTRYYRNAFKKIQYFTDDPEFIYYGNIKALKKYGKNYALIFEEYPFYEGKRRQISIYITDELINSYRKRKLFHAHIEALSCAKDKSIQCFFVGAYPQLKEEDIKTPSGSFQPLEVYIKNLDHLVLRFNEDGEDL